MSARPPQKIRAGLVSGLLLLTCAWPSAQARLCLEMSGGENAASQVVYFADWSRLRHRAERGDADAQFQLGNLYYAPPESSGIPQSYRKAFELYWAAAQRGHATAQHNVGVMYVNGDYVPASLSEGYAWFMLSASNGDPAGQRRLDDFRDRISDNDRRMAETRYRALLDMVADAGRNNQYTAAPRN